MEENSLIWAYNYACLSGGLSFVVLHDKGPYFIQFCFSVISSTKISLLQTNLSFDDLVGSISVVAFVVVSRQWHVCLSLIIGHQPHCCHPRLPTGNSHVTAVVPSYHGTKWFILRPGWLFSSKTFLSFDLNPLQIIFSWNWSVCNQHPRGWHLSSEPGLIQTSPWLLLELLNPQEHHKVKELEL